LQVDAALGGRYDTETFMHGRMSVVWSTAEGAKSVQVRERRPVACGSPHSLVCCWCVQGGLFRTPSEGDERREQTREEAEGGERRESGSRRRKKRKGEESGEAREKLRQERGEAAAPESDSCWLLESAL
jgi:hypothetical protein